MKNCDWGPEALHRHKTTATLNLHRVHSFAKSNNRQTSLPRENNLKLRFFAWRYDKCNNSGL